MLSSSEPKGVNRRRRRRRQPARNVEDDENLENKTNIDTSNPNDTDYYDDESDDAKGHRSSHHERMFKDSCSFGQFVLNPCLCMFHMMLSWWLHFRRKPRIAARHVLIIVLMLMLLWTTIGNFFIQIFLHPTSSSLPHPWHYIRPYKDKNVNRILVHIPVLDASASKSDIGGWRQFRHFFLPSEDSLYLSMEKIADHNDTVDTPDFGGLDLYQNLPWNSTRTQQQSIQKHRPERKINPKDAEIAEKYWYRTHIDHGLEEYYEPAEAIEDKKRKCRRPNWMYRYYPFCNAFHEGDLTYNYDIDRAKSIVRDDQFFDTFFINHGYYRDVWVIDQPAFQVKSILKMTRWKHEYNPSTYIKTLMDATVMERLSASPRIVDIFGHCGSAVWVEAIPYEVEEVIVHGDGYMKKGGNQPEQVELKSLNQFTPEEKLEMALTMAESIADLHGFADGVIVHDDVQLCQWLRTKNGQLKLGDFNRAEIMEYNEKKKEYCRYNNGEAYGNYRAPEEFAEQDLDEQIDVFSIGNNIYSLLTGLWPFYDNDNDDEVHKLLIDGKRAFVDPRWKERSFIENRLVEVMEQCWEHDASKRIDIFKVVDLLRRISEDKKRRKEKAAENK